MKYVAIPGSTLRVSRICLGTAALGSIVDQAESEAMLDMFVEQGGTFIDTAHVYADWIPGERSRSEKTLGRWLRTSPLASRVIVATKGGHPTPPSSLVPRLARQDVWDDLLSSLDNLGLQTIDLYWLHRDDPTRPVEEIMETLHAMIASGHVRYIGCSNWRPERLRAAQAYASAHDLPTFVASQVLWSLAVGNPGVVAPDHAVMDDAAFAYYRNAGMAVLGYTSQARGLFSKAAQGIEHLPDDLQRDFINAQTLARLERARTLAHQMQTTMTAINLAYLSSQPFVSIPVIGCRTIDQLQDSLRDADRTLSPDTLAYLIGDTQEVRQ